MTRIVIDFETYSATPIDAGSVKYTSDKQADIIVLAYKIDDNPTLIWLPDGGRTCPGIFKQDDIVVYAHNALFDYLVWHKIGAKYRFPEIPLPKWCDTQALANRYTLPGALDKAGAVMGTAIQKNKQGKALIRRICIPTKTGKRPKYSKDFTHQDLHDFIEYAKQDVESTHALLWALPATHLSDLEQEYWELTQRMNMRGLPVDTNTADKILTYVEGYVDIMTDRVPEITNGSVEKVTQIAKMVKWLNTRGIKVDDLRAFTVQQLLKTNLPEDVKELLTLRRDLGRSSTAKYRKIEEMQKDGRIYNNLQYYGTSTGRWAGRGFQLHNLPRASVDDPSYYINRFNNNQFVDNPVHVAKALIRPMICAEPHTHLIVADYKAIENRLLAWVAQDEEALNLLRQGGDQYIDMASFMYRKSYANISQAERQIGKIIILGCGYGMGASKFVETANAWGVDLSHSEALAAVNAYRAKYHKVKTMWYSLKDKAVAAIQYPGHSYTGYNCVFKVVKCRNGNKWLVLTLPSGRNLYYMDPYLAEDDYGYTPGHHGTNAYTKKWARLRLIPGRITENIIQALARDVMAYGLRNIWRNMHDVKLIGTVHDEAIGEIPDRYAIPKTVEKFNRWLCKMPEWAEGLPLAAEGYITKRYRKG